MASELIAAIDYFSFFRGHLFLDGWVFHPDSQVTAISLRLPSQEDIRTTEYCLPSPDVALHHGTGATDCRFTFDVPLDDVKKAQGVSLIVELESSPTVVIDVASRIEQYVLGDPYHELLSRFFALMAPWRTPTVVEIGSRRSPGDLYSQSLPDGSHYVGLDIKPGPNVDIVGDAHVMSNYFPESTVDAVFSLSTIEHLAMPWKVVIELNRILKPGGIVFLATHQTWPVHEAPWDYWRLSEYAWKVLLNRATGFEIIDVAMGSPGSIVADMIIGGTVGLEREPAFLGTGVLARKVGATTLSWNVDLESITDLPYPG